MLTQALICQNSDCKRKIGEASGTNYRVVIKCRRCKHLNIYQSK